MSLTDKLANDYFEMSDELLNAFIHDVLKITKFTENMINIIKEHDMTIDNYKLKSKTSRALFVACMTTELNGGLATKEILKDYELANLNIPQSFIPVKTMVYINICINDRIYQAFIDTGASISNMSKKVMDENGFDQRLNKKYKIDAIGVGTSRSLGKIFNLQFSLGSQIYSWNFNVFNHGPDFIIGLDFLNCYCESINIRKRTLTIETDTIQMLDSTEINDESSLLQQATLYAKNNNISVDEAYKQIKEADASSNLSILTDPKKQELLSNTNKLAECTTEFMDEFMKEEINDFHNHSATNTNNNNINENVEDIDVDLEKAIIESLKN